MLIYLLFSLKASCRNSRNCVWSLKCIIICDIVAGLLFPICVNCSHWNFVCFVLFACRTQRLSIRSSICVVFIMIIRIYFNIFIFLKRRLIVWLRIIYSIISIFKLRKVLFSLSICCWRNYVLLIVLYICTSYTALYKIWLNSAIALIILTS